jgi:hypothetical protein
MRSYFAIHTRPVKNNRVEGIRIVPTDERYAESLALALDVVARERRYIGFVEGPPVDGTREFVRRIVAGSGVQMLALTSVDEVVGWCDIIRNRMEGFQIDGTYDDDLLMVRFFENW